jgi:hypothetical protein
MQKNVEKTGLSLQITQSKKNAGKAMQIDCKVFAAQLVWGIVTNGIF